MTALTDAQLHAIIKLSVVDTLTKITHSHQTFIVNDAPFNVPEEAATLAVQRIADARNAQALADEEGYRNRILHSILDLYPGDFIIYDHPDNGWPSEQLFARERLNPNCVYTIAELSIGTHHSNVMLVEFPKLLFNSVMFSPYTPVLSFHGAQQTAPQ